MEFVCCRHLGLDMGTGDRFAARGSQGSTALFRKLCYCFLKLFNTIPIATPKPETHISTEFFYLANFPVQLVGTLRSKPEIVFWILSFFFIFLIRSTCWQVMEELPDWHLSTGWMDRLLPVGQFSRRFILFHVLEGNGDLLCCEVELKSNAWLKKKKKKKKE